MNGRVSRATDLARAVFARVREADVPFLAAGIAYFGFVSLPSLAILAVVAASAVGGQQLVDAVVRAASDVLTPSARSVLEEALTTTGGRGTATLAGSVVLLWSGLRLFRGLDQAFGDVYEESRERSLTEQLRDAVLVLGVVGLAVLAMALAATAVTALSGIQFAGLLSTAALLVGLFVVFLPLYVVFPGESEDLRGAVPGTVVATVGWTVLESTFRIYAMRAVSSPVYGLLGGALLLATWLYFAAVVLLVGAAVNATLSADRQVQSPGDPRTGLRAMAGDRPNGDRDRESGGGSDGEMGSGGDGSGGGDGPPVTGGRSGDARPDGGTAPGDGADSDSPADGDGYSGDGDTRPDGGDSRADDGDRADSDGRADNGDRADDDSTRHEHASTGAPDLSALGTRFEEVAERVESLEERTVHRDAVEDDLRRYVRKRLRRGHASGWGPYLVLLYGTAMTLGAFYYLSRVWAILAMVVIWLSTLGLYVFMVVVGVTVDVLGLLGLPRRVASLVGRLRSRR